MAIQPIIIRENEPYQSIERVKSRILDLQENATTWFSLITENKLLRKKSKLNEKRFISAVLAFATEVKPKILSLTKTRNLSKDEIDSARLCMDNTVYFQNYPTDFKKEDAVHLLIRLNDIIDALDISSIIKPSGRTIDRKMDISNVR